MIYRKKCVAISMDLKKFLLENNLDSSPSGLGGCRVHNSNFTSCDYDITLFDNSHESMIIEDNNELFFIHSGSLTETKSEILVHYDGMEVLNDESWELRMFLSKIKEKRLKIFRDYARNCFLNALFCCQRVKDGIKESDDFVSCWQKCASLFLGDGIAALNFHPPSSHMLYNLRQTKKNSINEKISIINETIGIERATPLLLDRMLKSTIGFSDIVEKNNHSKVIEKKHHYFLENSMFSDCYYYLCHVNKDNFIRIKDSLHRRSDLMHILKISFDIERDSSLLEQQSIKVQKASNEILQIISHP